MYIDSPFFEPANDWVIVWVGDLSAAELDEYLYEPGGAGGDEPISEFCRDCGRWYDHDFIWSEGSNTPVPIHKLCAMNGIEPVEFTEAIVDRCGSGDVSSLLVLWNARQINNSERTFAQGRMRYIGCWEQLAPLRDPD